MELDREIPQVREGRRHERKCVQENWGTPKAFTIWNMFLRFEGFTTVTMKNAVFWDIQTQFVPHRRHITSPL
jgi:hypothetical protein